MNFCAATIHRQCVTVVTQVLVDSDDPAMHNPSKPIGSFYKEEDARAKMEQEGWVMVEDAGRGWRRVVPIARTPGDHRARCHRYPDQEWLHCRGRWRRWHSRRADRCWQSLTALKASSTKTWHPACLPTRSACRSAAHLNRRRESRLSTSKSPTSAI